MQWTLKMNFISMVFLLCGSLTCMCCSLGLLGSGGSFFVEWEILGMNSLSVVAAAIIDWMSMMFMSLVMFISSMVLYYSGGYMSGDQNINRFLYVVLGFVGSMCFLIISPNLVSILLGWDGLGLVSYALVIYYQNEKSANAGMLTALSNRIGDVAILLAISLVWGTGSSNFIFLHGVMGVSIISFVVLAAMTKSAQIPFSAWLPAAMAAPTPVSALVHSSTLVTAGVYLLIRFSPSLGGSGADVVLLLLASLTMFMAGLGANFETDLKKIIALSTLSQLGVMMTVLSIGMADLAFFHLLTHALFKALLFMSAGSIIHSVGDSQDIRSMGSVAKFMPISVMMINLASLALCGFPFLAGFYSKDLILELAFMGFLNELCFWLLVMSTGLTVCYSFRLVFYSLTGHFNLSLGAMVSDEDHIMTWPMIMLGCGAVVGGAVLSWVMFPAPKMVSLTFVFKLLALFVSVLGGLLGYLMNMVVVGSGLKSLWFYPNVVFSGSMWFMPYLSTQGASGLSLKLGEMYLKEGDAGWSEHYGGQGLYSVFTQSSVRGQLLHDNGIKVYMALLIVWLVLVIYIV